MAQNSSPLGPLLPMIRATLASVRLSELSDGELLARFVATRDEAAFTELVRCLGPSVFGVCRRMLGADADAEDVFQVVFMVLARKAGSVLPPGRVAAWLHGVATLCAKKARAARNRRCARETTVDGPIERTAPGHGSEPDLGRVLDEELNRLPAKFRLPVVLCEVRELTVAQAAAELDWPVGTVSSRLSRGRELLAARLVRRGITAGAALATVGGVVRAAAAAVPPGLVGATVSAAGTGGAVPPAGVPPLLNEVLRDMRWIQMRALGAGLITVAAVAAVALIGFGQPRPISAAPVPAAPVPPEPTKDALDRMKVENLSVLLQIEEVQKDIGLTEEQGKKLDALRAEVKSRTNAAQKALQQIGGGVGDTANAIVDGLDAIAGDPAFDKGAAGVVTPAQLRRLKQISLQATGPRVLLDRRVIRSLGLSAEQEDRIDALVPVVRPNAMIVELLTPQGANKAAEKTDAAWAAALKTLTPDQRTKWDALTGKVLPTADLQKIYSKPFDPLKNLLPNLNPNGAISPGRIVAPLGGPNP